MTTNRSLDRTIDLRFDLDLVDGTLDLAFGEIAYHLAALETECDALLPLYEG